VLETGDYTDRVKRIVDEMKEAMDNFSVSDPYFIDMSRIATAEAGSPSDRIVAVY
jgi:hypothetical protein